MSHKIVGLVLEVSVNELVKNEILYLRGAHDIGIIMWSGSWTQWSKILDFLFKIFQMNIQIYVLGILIKNLRKTCK